MPATWNLNKPSDFDPFLDTDEPASQAIEEKACKTLDIISCEPAELANVPFTIVDIVEEPQKPGGYHFFKWRLFVRTHAGQECTFLLNPAKGRNSTLEQISKELPKQNMTLVQKQFTERRNFKLITYYDLVPYNPTSGTISH